MKKIFVVLIGIFCLIGCRNTFDPKIKVNVSCVHYSYRSAEGGFNGKLLKSYQIEVPYGTLGGDVINEELKELECIYSLIGPLFIIEGEKYEFIVALINKNISDYDRADKEDERKKSREKKLENGDEIILCYW